MSAWGIRGALLSAEVPVAPYVPAWVLAQEASGRTQGEGAFVVLFADISGFTALTRALTAAGREGAERLAAALRRYLDPLVDAVQARGGFVTGFAGDALTALFPVQPGRGAAAAARAAADEALAFFAAAPVLETPWGRFPFALKVGLSAGPVRWRILALDEGRRRALFDGPALRGAGEAERSAQAGEVVADAAFVAMRAAEGAGAGPPAPVAGPFAPAAPFAVPGSERVPAEGEFRHAAHVFVGWSQGAVEGIVAAADRLARRHGGVLLYTGVEDKGGPDGQGGAALICFGAPVAFGLAATRAARFVGDLRRAVAVPLRAGLTYDLVYAGFHGGRRRHEFTVLGGPVNLAARLMTAAAPGETLVAGRASERLAVGFAVEELGRRVLKGFAEPVAVARLGAARPVAAPAAELVGVEALLAELATQLDGGEAVWLSGPAGAGKTALAAQLRHDGAAGRCWLAAPCDAVRPESLRPLIEALRAACPDVADVDALRDWLETRGAGLPGGPRHRLLRAAVHLGAALGLADGVARTAALDPRSRAHLTRLALRRWLEAEAARGPVVVYLEDADHADADTLALLSDLHGAAASLAVVACGRRPPPADWPGAHRRVPALSLASIETLLARRLDGPASPELLQVLAERTAGIAFLADQLAARLVEDELLVRRRGRWTLAGPAESLPRDAESLLVARLDGLPPDQSQVVRTAAVIGVDVPLDLLDAVCTVADLPACIDALDQRGIWEPVAGHRRFRPALLRDAAYHVQARSTLRRLHGRIADAIERSGGMKASPATLALHRERAGDRARAVALWTEAAEAAASRADLSELDRCLQHAIALLDAGDAERARLCARRAREVLVERGKLTEAAALLDTAIADARASGEPGVLALALRNRGVAATYAEGPAAGERWFRQAREVAEGLADGGELARALGALAVNAHMAGDVQGALEAYAAAEAQAVACGATDTVLNVRSNRGLLLGALGRPEEGLAVLEPLLSDPGLAAGVRLSLRQNQAHLLLAAGRGDEAVAAAEGVLHDAGELGFVGIEAQCAVNLGSTALDEGRAEDARRLAARARAAAEDAEQHEIGITAVGFSARLARLVDGDLDQARAWIDQGLARIDEVGGAGPWVVSTLLERGHLALMAGEDGRPWLERARAVAAGGRGRDDAIDELAQAIEVAEAGGTLVRGTLPALGGRFC